MRSRRRNGASRTSDWKRSRRRVKPASWKFSSSASRIGRSAWMACGPSGRWTISPDDGSKIAAARSSMIPIRLIVALAIALGPSGVFAAESTAPAEPPKAAEAAKAAEAKAEDPSAIPAALQGPAVRAPREIFEMLEQRKHALQRREDTLRTSEAR